MDVTALVKDAVEKITGDADLTKAFKADPTATVKKVAGDKVPAEAIDKIVAGRPVLLQQRSRTTAQLIVQ